MIINSDLEIASVQVKLPFKSSKGHMLQYTLVACDGTVCLNGREITPNTSIEPVVKGIQSSRGISIQVPPLSVSFFDLPHADLFECSTDTHLKYEVVGALTSKNATEPTSIEPLSSFIQGILDGTKHELEILTRAARQITGRTSRQRRDVSLDKVFDTIKNVQDMIPADVWLKIIPKNIRDKIVESGATTEDESVQNHSKEQTHEDPVNRIISQLIAEQEARKAAEQNGEQASVEKELFQTSSTDQHVTDDIGENSLTATVDIEVDNEEPVDSASLVTAPPVVTQNKTKLSEPHEENVVSQTPIDDSHVAQIELEETVIVPESEKFFSSAENNFDNKMKKPQVKKPRKIFTRASRPLRQLPKLSDLFKPITPPQLPKTLMKTGKSLLQADASLKKFNIPGIDLKDSSVEAQVFKSAENIDFPLGELTLAVAKSNDQTRPDADYDYVNFEGDESSKTTTTTTTGGKPKDIKATLQKEIPERPGLEYTLNTASSSELEANFYDGPGGDYIDPGTHATPHRDQPETELAEKTIQTTKNLKYKVRGQNGKPDNVHYAVLVKELQPTVRQNQNNLRKAQQKIASFQLGDVDAPPQQETPEYSAEDTEYFNEEDDGFFNSGENADKIKRHMLNSAASPINSINNRIDTDDKLKLVDFKGERLISAFGKLLKKMEKTLTDNFDNEYGIRTRRHIERVFVPSRKTRKAPQTVKTKAVSKMQPVDIEDLPEASLNYIRKRRAIIDSSDTSSLNDIDSILHENEIVLDDYDYGLDPEEDSNLNSNYFSYSTKYSPKLNHLNTSATAVTLKPLTETTDYTSNEIKPFHQDNFVKGPVVDISSTDANQQHIKQVKFYDSFVKPFVELFREIRGNSEEFFKLIF